MGYEEWREDVVVEMKMISGSCIVVMLHYSTDGIPTITVEPLSEETRPRAERAVDHFLERVANQRPLIELLGRGQCPK